MPPAVAHARRADDIRTTGRTRMKTVAGRGRPAEKQPMPTRTQRKNAKRTQAGVRTAGSPKDEGRDEGWEERLRLVGDARFVDVQWSGRDEPSWPLPKK
jgi:hypothetical protein